MATDPPRPLPPTEALELLRTVRDQRFGNGLSCVHCSSHEVGLWGSFSGRQRYRCKSCRRTFSDLTNTPMYRTKRLHKWPAYFIEMQRTSTVRGSAQLLGVHHTTTFRWRHRILDGMRTAAQVTLAGETELLRFRFPWSEKGARHLQRPAYGFGLKGVGWIRYPERFEVVLIARDRRGNTAWRTTQVSRPPTSLEYCHLLDPYIETIGCLVATPEASVREYAYARGIPLMAVGVHWYRDDPYRTPAHVWNAKLWQYRFADWVYGFRGIASKYLHNYLAWRRWLDGADESLLAWRWVNGSVAVTTVPANTGDVAGGGGGAADSGAEGDSVDAGGHLVADHQ